MKKHHKLPKIYLIFTDLLIEKGFKTLRKYRKPIRRFILVYLAAITFFMFGASTFALYDSYQKKEAIDKKLQEINNEISYWKRIVDKYKDYRDGYFQLAILEYRLRDFAKSREYLDKALKLDPNFEKGIALEQILNR